MNKEEINFSPTGIESFRSRIITIYKYINAEYSKKNIYGIMICVLSFKIFHPRNKSVIAFCKSRRIFLHMFQVIYIQTVE